jgi:hypothetical protein
MGPIGPHLPCPDGAVRPLLSSSSWAHAGSTAPPPGRDREPKGIDANNTPPRWPAPVLEDDLQDQAVEQIESDTTYSDPLFAANYKAPGGTVWRRQDHKQKGST